MNGSKFIQYSKMSIVIKEAVEYNFSQIKDAYRRSVFNSSDSHLGRVVLISAS